MRWRRTAPARTILSNNHVLADESQLPIGAPIFQPGLLDGGNPNTDQVAALTKFIPLSASGNKVDCAIAKVLNNSLVSKEVLYRRADRNGRGRDRYGGAQVWPHHQLHRRLDQEH